MEEYSVTIRKVSVSSELGIDVDHADGVSILINSVNGGAVQVWNDAHPELEIRPGDRILEVNGTRGDAFGNAKLVGEILKNEVLEMKLRREVAAARRAAATAHGTAGEVAEPGPAVCSEVISDTPRPESVPKHLEKVCRSPSEALGNWCPRALKDLALDLEAKAFQGRLHALAQNGGLDQGDLYGVHFPQSSKQLEELGTEWLTQALRTAGSLPTNNEVTRIVSVADMKRSQVSRIKILFLTVEYAKPSAALHSELCVRLPPAEVEKRKVGWQTREDFQQVIFARFFGGSLPFRTPKYYFGDISLASGNFILINERIPFADDSAEGAGREPYAIGVRHPRLLACSIPDRADKYFALFRKAALLAAWAHCGRLGTQLGQLLEAPVPGAFPREAFRRIAEGDFQERWESSRIRHLVLNTWQKLFPADVANAAFLAQLRRDALSVARYLPDVRQYILSSADPYWGLYCSDIALQHYYYWRDGEGRVDCGLLNFQSLSMGHVCECFRGLHTAPGDTRVEHARGFVRYFTDTLRDFGGPQLDAEEVFLQVSLYDMAAIIRAILDTAQTVYAMVPQDQWSAISSRQDPVFLAERHITYSLRGCLAAIVDGIVAWKGLRYHEQFAKWKASMELLPLDDKLRKRLAACGCRRLRSGSSPVPS